MADSNCVEKSLLENIQDLLKRKPGTYDVASWVEKEKKIVGALKVILKASSPFLEKEFEEKWEVAVMKMKEGDGIPLPDFDPIAFELFVELTYLDSWSLGILETLKLQPHQILNLLTICRRFKLKKAVDILNKLATLFLQSFDEYVDTEDFLQLSQANLKFVLASDDIGIKELDVFYAAMRWADFQSKEMKVQPTDKLIRKVLGGCFYEIRFPIMTCVEFTEASASKDILTAEENLEIYRFIGLAANKKSEFDTSKLPFKITQRKQAQALESKRNSEARNTKAITPPGITTLCLAQNSEIMENRRFICDGRPNTQLFACEEKIEVYGLGFFTPIENDGFYDVKVALLGHGNVFYSGMLEKRIFAEKGKKFYFIFDAPIELPAGDFTENTNKFYGIKFYLKGANTSACNRALRTGMLLHEGGTIFRLSWRCNQLAEILFKLS